MAMPEQPVLPKHVAIIMDGNGRWATARGQDRLQGHAAGVEAVRRTCEAAITMGIPVLTFWAFSTKNWKRPETEVSGIFNLLRWYFGKELKKLVADGIRVRVIGNCEDGKLAPDVVKIFAEVEAATAHCDKLLAQFAINYSGRDELVRAAQTLVAQGGVVTEASFAAALDTEGVPDPDLVIRTSGEQRLSDFLPWQIADAELYFTEMHWPDFGREALEAAVASFAGRERRFGGVGKAEPNSVGNGVAKPEKSA
jgi:undecaprenyl diphosphate synthase